MCSCSSDALCISVSVCVSKEKDSSFQSHISFKYQSLDSRALILYIFKITISTLHLHKIFMIVLETRNEKQKFYFMGLF